MKSQPIHTGNSHPLGATLVRGGANFSLFSRAASGVELLFFDRADDARPSRTLALQAHPHRTYHYWHVFVPAVQAGQLYGYRVHGPNEPACGLRFDPSKVLLDPYARGVVMPPNYNRQAAAQPGDNAATAMKSVVTDPAAYDWEGDEPLRRSSVRTIIYEMHVRGFTRHPSSGVAESKRGTEHERERRVVVPLTPRTADGPRGGTRVGSKVSGLASFVIVDNAWAILKNPVSSVNPTNLKSRCRSSGAITWPTASSICCTKP